MGSDGNSYPLLIKRVDKKDLDLIFKKIASKCKVNAKGNLTSRIGKSPQSFIGGTSSVLYREGSMSRDVGQQNGAPEVSSN